jgi:hypothetical protein
VGFAATFGMLLFPVFLARRRTRHIPDRNDRMLVAGVSLIIGIIAIDLIPNGLWDGYPYLFAGALMGVSRNLASTERRRGSPSALVTRAA